MTLPTLARWTSAPWWREAQTWCREVLAGRGLSLTGEPELVHVQFWSVVARVPTDQGVVWFKEVNPGQGFEPALLAALAKLEPNHFPTPLAVDELAGRVLLPDLESTQGSEVLWPGVLAEMAGVQRRLAHKRDVLMKSGLPVMEPADIAAYSADVAEQLHRLPRGHAQRLSSAQMRDVEAGMRTIGHWADLLTGSSIPLTFQHHDVSPSNTFTRSGESTRWIDVGDAFWTHPFAVLQVPMSMMTGTWPWGPDWSKAEVAEAVDAYFTAWAGSSDVDAWRPLLEPSWRLAILQRGESWRRLLTFAGDLQDDEAAPRVGQFLSRALSVESTSQLT